ncbi:hypothetical protein BKA70DRAFT_1265084 [Coprinopsis sp. MPI-PUGE-AT-0042]|nr:hypothetical protein BKA70DRAFT_1265084 [Coprinopsis sp. MPI-PUGE-AT-0042]
MPPTVDRNRAIRRLTSSRQKVLQGAKDGVYQDLLDVTNFWPEVAHGSSQLPPGILDVLFHHLDADKTPHDLSRENLEKPNTRNAWVSLTGLIKVGNFFSGPVNPEIYDDEILAAWQGLFKWSAYFYAGYVEAPGVDFTRKRNAIDMISGCWYAICRTDRVREAMVSTQGSVEIVTRLWLLEDEGRSLASPNTMMGLPCASAAMGALITRPPNDDVYDRVIRTAAGKAETVAKLALARLKAAIKDITRIHEPQTTLYLELIIDLCRPANHPLRHAFLQGNLITLCTNIAVTVSRLLQSRELPGLIDLMGNAFGFLNNCLESTDGFSWVNQSIKAGLLGAYVDCSPFFSRIEPHERKLITRIVDEILPAYLVYRSVIEAVDSSIRALKLDDSPRKDRVLRTDAREGWERFVKLARERRLATLQAKTRKGRAVLCDNIACQRIDEKNTFRKCAACQTTLYCSRECQTQAWKEGGHKNMCILKQQERLEGKAQSISKSDHAFFHHLAPYEARRELFMLRELAKSSHPDIKLTELVIYIDFTVVPAKFSIFPLEDYEKCSPATDASVNAEARHDALVERARENPTRFTIIQSKLANGEAYQMSTTLVGGRFWKDGEIEREEGDSLLDSVNHALSLLKP